ncbi:hypothetical protein [Geomicrobium sediminis]|uniref:Uncharacterized protein n=1 Tax=Geomicrobium sediminis TaxID=1347788 RepID=A0ABS2P746_9BACL|nr:hypothetical protein [Geomicrobium sediminis]MBM7631124.1 hypothetical protein [Geomicrobium sediminis]
MNDIITKLVAELKRVANVETLDIKNKDYILQLQDGAFHFGWDEDEKTLKIQVSIGEEVELYHSDKRINDIGDSPVYEESESDE